MGCKWSLVQISARPLPGTPPARSLVDFSIRARLFDAPLGTQSAGSQVESQVVLSVQDGWRRLGTSKLLYSLDTDDPQQAPRKELPKLRVWQLRDFGLIIQARH